MSKTFDPKPGGRLVVDVNAKRGNRIVNDYSRRSRPIFSAMRLTRLECRTCKRRTIRQRRDKGTARRPNQETWGPLVPVEPVRAAVARYRRTNGVSEAELSRQMGWESSSLKKRLSGSEMYLSTADRILTAIGRPDVLHVELAHAYWPDKDG